MKLAAVAAAAALALVGSSAHADAQLEANKALVIRFYNALSQGDPDTLVALGRPDYRQHNPNFEDTIQGLVRAVKARPPRPPGSAPIPPLQFVRVIAEGDYVMTLRRMPPGPNAGPGPDNERANVDIFRVQDGKVAEHWDYMEQFPRGATPPKNTNGHF